jgi:uncharacterized RDD family membrane protein YckC
VSPDPQHRAGEDTDRLARQVAAECAPKFQGVEMSDVADARFAPPQAHVADLASGEVALASRWARFLALVVDTLISAGMAFAAGMVPWLQKLILAEDEANAGNMWALTPLSAVIATVGFFAVQGWPLLARGQTVGKMLFKLRIVRSDGSKVDPWRLLGLRYGIGCLLCLNSIAATVLCLIDALLIFRESRKCLHDTIADTKVIKLRARPTQRRRCASTRWPSSRRRKASSCPCSLRVWWPGRWRSCSIC